MESTQTETFFFYTVVTHVWYMYKFGVFYACFCSNTGKVGSNTGKPGSNNGKLIKKTSEMGKMSSNLCPNMWFWHEYRKII